MPHSSLHLVVFLDDGSSLIWPLVVNQTCLVGRGKLATLQIDDPYVSRAHFQIEAFPALRPAQGGLESGQGLRWVMTDLGSTRGTTVNGERVRRVELQPGDQIVVGHTRIHLADFDEGAPCDSLSFSLPPSVARASENRVDDLIGKTIHQFFIERVLARGAHGTVFLARYIDLNRDVAVKVLLPDEGNDDNRRRQFTAAMRTFRDVRHRNLVRLLGAGRLGPYCWLAMEYVAGENLKQVIDRIDADGKPDWKMAFHVALDIARGLEAAAVHQIVHRNITPKSILLRMSDKVAKLADLMLASTWTDTAQSVSTRVALEDELGYLAPERIQWETAPDHRCDIYGLGATVYGLLTGRPPCEAKSQAQMLNCLECEQPPEIKPFQPLISDQFEKAVQRMISKRPEARHQSAAELVKDLERIGKLAGIAGESPY